MDKLNELYRLCNASVTIIYNEHKDYYHTVESYLNDQELFRHESLEIEPIVRHQMIEMGHMYTLHAYPHTPIGFYTIYHYDLESAVAQMIDIIKKEK